MRTKRKVRLDLVCGVMVLLGVALEAPADPIPEPETTLYGKVLVASGGQDYLLREGVLSWGLRRPDGTVATYEAGLEALAGGAFSYRLKVPHEVLAAGLATTGDRVVPLGVGGVGYGHVEVMVDGEAARLVVPADDVVVVSQERRAQTLRIDLRVGLELADSDGDGMADWWEAMHGFNGQSAADALLDGDGDGLTNLAEFLGGTNPAVDNRVPELLAGEVIGYGDGRAGVVLQVADTDSGASEIGYRVTRLPEEGRLELGGEAVAVGAVIGQEEIDRGRLVYVHDGGEKRRLEFAVVVGDGAAGSESSVGISVYRGGGMSSGQADAVKLMRERAAGLSRDAGTTVWDLADAVRAVGLRLGGAEAGQIFYGGEGDDVFEGSDGDDLVWGGGGYDSLEGGGGADTFVFVGSGEGGERVEDFAVAEGDVLDLRLVEFLGDSVLASDYVRVDGEVLGIDLDGDGSGFMDRVIELAGQAFVPGDLRALLDSGSLLLDGLGLPPLVTLEATLAAASENDPSKAARIEITRSGRTEGALVVELVISGSATNGVDYSLLDPVVVFMPGQRSVVVEVRPFADAVTELDEVVEIRLKGASGYEVAAGGGAQVSIVDLMPSISLEAIEPLAVRDTATPGAFLISRSGVLDRGVFVRLNLAGTAVGGSDYEGISRFLSLAPGQTSGVVQVVPKGDGGEPVSVVMEIAEDGAYLKGEDGVAEIVIVDALETFEDFLDGGPAGEGSLATYAFGENGGGVPSRGGDGVLEIGFRRNVAAVDLDYVVEVSEDLRAWRPGGPLVEDVTPPALLRGEVGRKVYRLPVPTGAGADTYLRVRAVRR